MDAPLRKSRRNVSRRPCESKLQEDLWLVQAKRKRPPWPRPGGREASGGDATSRGCKPDRHPPVWWIPPSGSFSCAGWSRSHNAYASESVTIHYQWLDLFGKSLPVVRRMRRKDGDCVVCESPK